MDDLLKRAARVYGRAGWPVFPLGAGGKEPLISRAAGGRGFKDATTDLEQIDKWWSQHPDANIGMPTGIVFDVLDVDVRSNGNGYAHFERLARAGYLSGALAEARTRNAGLHLFYPPSGCGCRSFKGKFLDIKAKGGYVVMAPSKVAADEGIDGPGDYSWTDFDAQETQVTPLDVDAIARFLAPPAKFDQQETQRTPRTSSDSARHLIAYVGRASNGERNQTLFWAAMRLAEQSLLHRHEDELIRAVVNHGTGDESFSEDEARRTIGSAKRKAGLL